MKVKGTISAKNLENFTSDMHEYFTPAKIAEHRQVSMAICLCLAMIQCGMRHALRTM